MDYFKTFENIKNAFIKYVKLLPDNGLLVVNADDNNCLDLLKYTNATQITYGINNENANFVAHDISFNNNGFPTFSVYKNSKFLGEFSLSVAGQHNILNALSCIALCDYYGIHVDILKQALLEFTGAHRRLEFKGTFNNVSVYDDYAHHPTEITATRNALYNKKFNKAWVIFQPHTYSRTKNLLDDFAKALIDFDHIILTDIYAARETATYGVTSKTLAEKIEHLGKHCDYISSFDDIVEFIKNNAQDDDIVLTLGAGNVTDIGPMLLA